MLSPSMTAAADDGESQSPSPLTKPKLPRDDETRARRAAQQRERRRRQREAAVEFLLPPWMAAWASSAVVADDGASQSSPSLVKDKRPVDDETRARRAAQQRERRQRQREAAAVAAKFFPPPLSAASSSVGPVSLSWGSNVPSTRPEAASAVDGISTQRRRPYLCKKHTTKSKGTSTSSLTRIRSSASMRSRNTQTEVCAQVDRVTQTARIVIGTATQT
ncbi:uncharacterized protein LOC144128249 isoform X1 [Amblyomma americanum]